MKGEFPPSHWTPDVVLDWRVRETPDVPFITSFAGETVTFAEFGERVRVRMAGLLSAGVREGDRVALILGNSIDHLALWFGANLLGASDAPINPSFSGRLLAHALSLIDPAAIVCDSAHLSTLAEVLPELPRQPVIRWLEPDAAAGLAPALHEAAPLDGGGAVSPGRARLAPSGIASILSTSGTTGPAKGVMVTHAQAYLTALQTVEGLRVTGSDVYYCSHPLFHMSPRFCVIYAALLTGAQVCLDARFSAPDWIDRIRATGATVTIGHGPLLEMIQAQPERPNDADTKLTRLGTSPFPRHIASDFERRFGLKGIETWGMTEINIPCWHPWDEPLRPGSCGRIREEWYDFAVVDPETDEEVADGTVGEFVVRPKLPWIVSPGYIRNPEATLRSWRNLWFHTGDSGYRDPDGWIYFVDRLGDRIRRRAENISSYDIELVANAHPAVQESAAIGVPSGFASDDDIMLCVLPSPGSVFDPVELLAYLAQSLPHHMVPRYIERVQEMPRTSTQKIRKSSLRAAGVSATTWDRKAAGIALRTLMDPEPKRALTP